MMIKTEQELSEAISTTNGPLRIIGGGTRPIGNPVAGAALRVSGLSGVTLYEPGALTLVARAGTPLAEVEALLESEGQQLAFEPMDHRGLLGTQGAPTIGGVVAANISGPRRIQSGACRDFLLGVRFVDGMGRMIKNGGRVMKNVTGYDLVKLMAGSFGTLGVLSEVSLKVLPKAETRAVLLIDGLSDERAIAALSQALGSAYDVTGAAHIPVGLDGDPVTMIRLEGFAASVAYRAEKLKNELADFGTINIETRDERTEAGWRYVRDVQAFHNQSGDVWRISVKPTDGPKAGAILRNLGARLQYDWGGGLVWALVTEGTDVRAALKGIKGHARLERGSGQVAFPSQGVLLDKVATELRHRFDPRGILNSGLMG
jgi:glycolate dehydrogenase FAD-binding subunit